MPEAVLAPGARVVVRDAEWVVRRVDQASDGGQQLVCDGLSELVRERETIFLTSLEGGIQALDRARTELVPDTSPGFADSLLYMGSQLRQAVPSDDRVHVGHGAAMDVVPSQLEPARQALRQPRQRIDDLVSSEHALDEATQKHVLARQGVIHTLGNLTVVTVPSNSAVSNAGCEQKGIWLQESLLAMNLEISQRSKWDEDEILSCSERLADVVVNLWPAPKGIA